MELKSGEGAVEFPKRTLLVTLGLGHTGKSLVTMI